MDYSHNDGLNAVNRVKLLMNYSLDKTLKENIDKMEVLNEQSNSKQGQPPRPETSKGNWAKDKITYQSKNPGMVWDPNSVNYPSVEYQTPQKNPGSDYFLNLKNTQANQLRQKLMTKGNWVKINPKNVGLRGTPFGFHPLEYPGYLKKVAEINKKYPDDKSIWYNPTTWFDNDTDNIRNQELEKLKNQYFHKEFPFGVTQEDYQDWLKAKKTISDEQVKKLCNMKSGGGVDLLVEWLNEEATFIENNSENGVESGEIVSFSTELSPLLAELSTDNTDSTTEIYFFGGTDENQLFYFLKSYFEKHHLTNDINELLRDIRFDFLERMDSFEGGNKVHPYELWHKFLHFLSMEDLIKESTLVVYAQDTYF